MTWICTINEPGRPGQTFCPCPRMLLMAASTARRIWKVTAGCSCNGRILKPNTVWTDASLQLLRIEHSHALDYTPYRFRVANIHEKIGVQQHKTCQLSCFD